MPSEKIAEMRERRDRLRRLDVSAMTPERLQHIKDQYERWGEAALERACSELIDHIDALTAEPSRVEDTEVAEVINALLQPGEYGSEPPTFDVKVANLLSRIAAAKASAERERDQIQAAFAARAIAAEKATRQAIAQTEMLAERGLELTDQLAEAQANLREARGLALEEAAKVVETIADDRFREHGSTEPDTNASYYQGSQAEFYEAQDEENENCVTAIRALKQRSQT